jgi:membrane protease YdiL (CAAX protease family)
MSTNALQTLYSALVYVVSLVITIFVPWKLAKSKTTRDELGLRGLPTWTDILLAPVGFIVFMIVAVILVAILQAIFPGVNWNESQDVGFSNLISSSDFILAFISLVVVAPVAEELIFRGWLYGKLRAKIPAIPAMLVVSILFGIVHGQWNVGVTVFVMSIAMCTLREITGTIWGGILIHILKNGIAFYFLYVNPMMIQ